MGRKERKVIRPDLKKKKEDRGKKKKNLGEFSCFSDPFPPIVYENTFSYKQRQQSKKNPQLGAKENRQHLLLCKDYLNAVRK